MTKLYNRLCRLSVAAASVTLLAGPSLALARHAHGWKVLAPVMLDIDGRLLAPMVGTTLVSASATYGTKVIKALDRECGK
jgi:hypothetical protein